MLHTDSGNEFASFNHTLSLGNFSGGEVGLCPALNSFAAQHPAPEDSATQEHPAGSQLLGEAVDTWQWPTTFPCSSLHCTLPWQGDRWVITAYTCRDPLALSLQALGFQLPVRPSVASYSQVSAQLQDSGASPSAMEFFLDVCCGASAPLSQALAAQHITCIRVDMLGDDPLDLSCNDTYDKLLRIAFSGCIKYAHASPPCRDYSRLKLRPGGPPAIRSPEHLDGLPGNTPQQQERVQSSQQLLYRCTCILRAAFSAGGHVSLEQPTNAMSWLESFVQSFLSEIQASLVVIPACSVGQDLAKSWLFATRFRDLQSLAAKCTHGSTHVQVAGKQDAQGHFLSQRTAEYPAELASKFCLHVAPLFNDELKHAARSGRSPQPPPAARFCALDFALQCIPRKPRSAPPFGAQDGGGIYSLPDWSYAPRYAADQLQVLRKEWQQWLLEKHVPARLSQHVSAHLETPLFTEAETAWLRASFCRFSATLSPSSGWDFEIAKGQPYCLTALERLSTILGDKDTSLFPALQQGVPTGFDDDIPRSHTLRPRRDADPDEGHDLLVCEGNWQGAESDPALLQDLIEEEMASGYLEEVPSLEAAYARWGQDRVAVGKVNIVKAPGRSPRLVVDNSVCNTNQNCYVPEQFSLPSLQDIESAFPLRQDSEEVGGFSLDVKGAHKTSRVRERDRGLLGMRQQERLLFYRVCPFGARFSSHWFARIGGFLTRALHLLVWLPHVLLLYVDDLLFFQNSKVLPLSASLILAFCTCFSIPLSWRKLQLGPTITWIGWELNFACGCFTLPEAKRMKLHSLVQECLRHRFVSKRVLDKLLGLLQWILHGFPALRPWLCSVYDDLHRPLGTNISINPTFWAGISSHLQEDMSFLQPSRY